MVIAGAGSGKTRVLTYRVARLLEKGVRPFNILTLTFTNKAAREMRERIDHIAGSEARNVWMGTFHSMFARILRIECERIGYTRNFTIYDSQDSKNLLKSIIKEMKLDDKVYKPSIVHSRISHAKNSLIPPQAYLANDDIMYEDRQSSRPLTGEIYSRYNARCFQSGAMDFDDLLFKTNELLRDHADILYKYQNHFQYILVDEYQDTNFSQYLIVKQLAAMNENICVVGDDAQSIYSFRGANIQNILNFRNDYPNARLFKLEQNYRSTSNIVNAANSVIAYNKEQISKQVWTENPEGSRIEVMKAHSDNEEGNLVASRIFELGMTQHLNYSHFAILYRTNAQSRAMEEALRKRDIPYRIYGGLSFYQRKEIKDLLAYFRLAINQNDEEALRRIINYPVRGIGKTTEEKLLVAAAAGNTGIWQVIKDPVSSGLSFNSSVLSKLDEFKTMIESFSAEAGRLNAYEAGTRIASSTGLLKLLYEDRTVEGVSRYENVQELLNGMKEFTITSHGEEDQTRNLAAFLQDVALLTDQDEEDGESTSRVSLMTVHLAKGLEFSVVFVTGMEENLFPGQYSVQSRQDLEEERRLFYVALTRAMKTVCLTYAITRFRWGELSYCEPSRFISEIDSRFIQLPEVKIRPGKQRVSVEDNIFRHEALHDSGRKKFVKLSGSAGGGGIPVAEPAIEGLTIGSIVVHERFGEGKVTAIEGREPNQKATVEFAVGGRRQLLLRFARLKYKE